MGKRERMSSIDTAWLRMDSPANLMMIVGIYEFDGPLDLARLRELITSRFARHTRMRSRVVQDATGYYWEEDDDFDLDHHLVRIALPGAGDEKDLKKLTGQLASQALDPMKPLWQMHLDNYKGGQAMVVRIHHCIADGIRTDRVLLAMTSGPGTRGGEPTSPAASCRAASGTRSAKGLSQCDGEGDHHHRRLRERALQASVRC
jgi:hypothetical protein